VENRLLVVSSSPHFRGKGSTARIMFDVIIALLPAVIGAWVFFRGRALIVLGASVAAAVLAEFLMLRVRGRKATAADINSAIVTGILLAFCVTATLPWWAAALGSAFGIAIAKHCFGGLGFNIFNPALAGRIFIMHAYIVRMTLWTPTYFEEKELQRPEAAQAAEASQRVDAETYATPLGKIKEGIQQKRPIEEIKRSLPSRWSLFVGNVGGCLGETSALLLLVGAAYLLVRRIITLHIPLAFLGSLALLTWIFGGGHMIGGQPRIHFFHGDPLFHVLAGGAVLGAFFMATDMVTSPMTRKGMLLFGFGCGAITTIIRLWGGFPEGVSYSIFLMNMCVPLIDRFTMPKLFGADFGKE
jgi:electron transport complex protein RnfD